MLMFSKPEPIFFDFGDTSFHSNHDPLFPAPPSSQSSPSFQRVRFTVSRGRYRGPVIALTSDKSGFSRSVGGPPMSTRQNNKKQRKGRNNANNRERTVTTLTEDPNTPYLIPTPSE